jgi:hypothetical protein
LTYTNLTTQRVIRWRLYIEEFRPTFHYIKGSENIIADFLSRTPLLEKQELLPSFAHTSDSSNEINKNKNDLESTIDRDVGHTTNFDSFYVDSDNEFKPSSTLSSFFASSEIYECIAKDPAVVDCFVLKDDDDDCFMSARLPESFLNVPPGPNPMDYARIEQLQNTDLELQQLRTQNPNQYPLQPFNNHQLICFIPPQQNSWKIYLPTAMINELITWYHHVLLHVGASRLFSSISCHFYHPQLRDRVDKFVRRCDECQQYK